MAAPLAAFIFDFQLRWKILIAGIAMVVFCVVMSLNRADQQTQAIGVMVYAAALLITVAIVHSGD